MTFGFNITKESLLTQIQESGELSFDEIDGIDIETKREFLNELVHDGAIHFVHDDSRFAYIFRPGEDPSIELMMVGLENKGLMGHNRTKVEQPKSQETTMFNVGSAYIDTVNKTGVKHFIGKYRLLWLAPTVTDVLMFNVKQDDFYCFLDNGTYIVFYDSFGVRGFTDSRKGDLSQMRLNDIKARVEHLIPVGLDGTHLALASIGQRDGNDDAVVFDYTNHHTSKVGQKENVVICRYKDDKYVCLALEFYPSKNEWKIRTGVNITRLGDRVCYKTIRPIELNRTDMETLNDGTFREYTDPYRWRYVDQDLRENCFQMQFNEEKTWRTVMIGKPVGKRYPIT